MTIEIWIWWSRWLLRLWVDGIMTYSRWDCLLSSIRACYCINSCYRKLLGKLTDRNICIVLLFYHLHGNIVHIVIVTLLILNCHYIFSVIEITWILIDLNNNVNRQLIPGLGKLMEETTSVFWVDLGYRLRSRRTVPLQGSEGWLRSHLFIVPQYYCEYYSTVILWVLLLLLST